MLPPPDDEQAGVYGATMDLSDHGPHDIAHYKELNKHPLPTGVGVLRVLVKTSRLKTPGACAVVCVVMGVCHYVCGVVFCVGLMCAAVAVL